MDVAYEDLELSSEHRGISPSLSNGEWLWEAALFPDPAGALRMTNIFPLFRRLDNFAAGARFLTRAVLSRYNPLLAQVVVTHRCNLSCGYCNEYDGFSPPVPLQTILVRVDHLARLNTASITLTGGEPLLHPNLDKIVRAARSHGMIATTITNGFRLNRNWIERLNAAGLHGMQVSIDNLEPDEVSMKSLASVERKLTLLSKYARFKVNINSVLGVSGERTEDVVTVAKAAARYGFQHSVGLLHDHSGTLGSLSVAQMHAYAQVTRISPSLVHSLNYRLFQKNLMHGRTNNWKCRAGARYLYVCENGLVHWCSQQRGYPAIPLLEYAREDIRREFDTQKSCSPACTLSCVHQVSMFDRYRSVQTITDPTVAMARNETQEQGIPGKLGVREGSGHAVR